jgi:hypothetical protein
MEEKQKCYNLKVIGAGLPRTGTLSLKIALEKLGYDKCYHMYTSGDHASKWVDIFQKNERNWEQIFKGYQSTTDAPGCFFWEDLLKDNPDAKIILTVRDNPEVWYKSCSDTVFQNMPKNFTFGYHLSCFLLLQLHRRTIMRRLVEEKWKLDYDSKESCMKYYTDYNEDVIKKCPTNQLLIFNVKDGWKPLCEFFKCANPKSRFSSFE